MIDLLDQALAATRDLAPEVQDDIARIVLELVDAGSLASAVTLTPGEAQAIAISKAAAARGDFATDAQVRAVWAKHGL